jgi:transketolase
LGADRHSAVIEGVPKGAYIVADVGDIPEVILMATGSEVHLALSAFAELSKRGVKTRVVSMPSWELFQRQPRAYRDQVIPPDIRARLTVEAGITLGWWKWVGDRGDVVGLDGFGASAPGGVVMEKYGFTAENIVRRALALLER